MSSITAKNASYKYPIATCFKNMAKRGYKYPIAACFKNVTTTIDL